MNKYVPNRKKETNSSKKNNIVFESEKLAIFTFPLGDRKIISKENSIKENIEPVRKSTNFLFFLI